MGTNNKKRRLTRDDILEVQDLEVREEYISAWKGVVRIRALTGTVRDQYIQDVTTEKGRTRVVNMNNISAKLCALSLVDEDDNLLFTQQEVAQLGNKNAQALSRIFEIAQEISGLDADIDELKKTSEKTAKRGSGSG